MGRIGLGGGWLGAGAGRCPEERTLECRAGRKRTCPPVSAGTAIACGVDHMHKSAFKMMRDQLEKILGAASRQDRPPWQDVVSPGDQQHTTESPFANAAAIEQAGVPVALIPAGCMAEPWIEEAKPRVVSMIPCTCAQSVAHTCPLYAWGRACARRTQSRPCAPRGDPAANRPRPHHHHRTRTTPCMHAAL